MLAQRRDVVTRGKFLDHFHVGGEAGAREDSLEQVVRQQRALRHAARERGLEGIDVVDALAREGSFTQQILVDVGDGGGVWIDAGRAREHPLEG